MAASGAGDLWFSTSFLLSYNANHNPVTNMLLHHFSHTTLPMHLHTPHNPYCAQHINARPATTTHQPPHASRPPATILTSAIALEPVAKQSSRCQPAMACSKQTPNSPHQPLNPALLNIPSSHPNPHQTTNHQTTPLLCTCNAQRPANHASHSPPQPTRYAHMPLPLQPHHPTSMRRQNPTTNPSLLPAHRVPLN